MRKFLRNIVFTPGERRAPLERQYCTCRVPLSDGLGSCCLCGRAPKPGPTPWARPDADPIADIRALGNSLMEEYDQGRRAQWQREQIVPGVSRCPADPDNVPLRP